MRDIEFAELRGDPVTEGGTVRLAGRCYTGPTMVGDTFTQARGTDEAHPVSLRVDAISFYGKEILELHPGETAELTLSGTGTEWVTPGVRLTGRVAPD